MSDTLRIALIAEGPTDKVIIEAALSKIIHEKTFVVSLLQPEATRPHLGGGWGGVLKWCREFRSRGYNSFEDDPTMELFDFFILHLDADVAHFSYSDVSLAIKQEAPSAGWCVLPCSQPCPPPETTITNLKSVLQSWLGVLSLGSKTVLCMPSKSTETWLAAAVYPDDNALLNGLECSLNMEGRLANLPKARRIKKKVGEYQNHAATISREWNNIRALCSQAEVFHCDCSAIVNGEAA